MLKQRILTALILIPLVLAALFYLPSAYFCLLTAAVALAGAWEWTNLIGLKKPLAKLCYLILMGSLFFAALFVPIFLILLLGFIWWVFAAFLVFTYPKWNAWWRKGIVWRSLMGVFVLVPCWIAINFIHNDKNGAFILLFLFILIWGADSVAYFCGKAWGKTKLLPSVSPGKTVEGLLGALVFGIFLVLIALIVCQNPYLIWPWAVLFTTFTILFSIVGDLFESMLKRNVGLKDSGHLLPGHGGLLDRIDSLTAACPVYTLFAILLGMYIVT